ncbi:LOW QUALITY PROTEIN: uncharacterized protein LOC119462121 [Dermacentor silvarum]|uniref:LOW QUALITY PROTEIN: uncharacterized protein LOC119462121 n=1 Tax=Dermacentor silvarum TaxID=543639 RepID=UPI0021009CA4|nr:LOW QUALITY PROTEIN: uncharacterized protein LOC119462121 [Dermacentor silvarum]
MATSRRRQSAGPPGPPRRRRRPRRRRGLPRRRRPRRSPPRPVFPGQASPRPPACAADDFLAYSFQRKAPYLVWDDEGGGGGSGCARHPHLPHYQGPLRSSRPWTLRHSRRCCPWPCVLATALASGLLFGALVALCAYLSVMTSQHMHPSVRLLGAVRVLEGDVWDPNLLNSTSKEFRIKSAKYANMLEAACRKSPLLNSSLSKVTIYAFRQGSLIVLFELEVDKRHTPAVADLESEFRQTLRREAEKGPRGAFGQLKIDWNAIQMTEMSENSLIRPGSLHRRKRTQRAAALRWTTTTGKVIRSRDSDQWINQHSQDPSDYFAPHDNESSPGAAGGANSWQPYFPEQGEGGERAEGEVGEVTWENAPELSEDDDSHYDGPHDRQESNSSQQHQEGHAVAAVNEHGSVVATTRPQVVTEPVDTTEDRYLHVTEASPPTGAPRPVATSQDVFTNKHGSELTELTVGAGVVVKANGNPAQVSTKNATKATPAKPILVSSKDGQESLPPLVSVEGPNVASSTTSPPVRKPVVHTQVSGTVLSSANGETSADGSPVWPPYKPLSSSEIRVGETPSREPIEGSSEKPTQGIGQAWQIHLDDPSTHAGPGIVLNYGPRPSQTATNVGLSHDSSATKMRDKTLASGMTLSVGTGLSVHQQPSVQKNNHRKELTTPKPTTSTTEFEIGVGLFVRPPVASGSDKSQGTRVQQTTKKPEPQFIDLTAGLDGLQTNDKGQNPANPVPPGRPASQPASEPSWHPVAEPTPVIVSAPAPEIVSKPVRKPAPEYSEFEDVPPPSGPIVVHQDRNNESAFIPIAHKGTNNKTTFIPAAQQNTNNETAFIAVVHPNGNNETAFSMAGGTREGHELKNPEMNITSISIYQTVSTSSGDHSEVHSVIYSGGQNSGGLAKFISGDLPSKAGAYDSKYTPSDEKGTDFYDKGSKNGDKYGYRPPSTTASPALKVVTRVSYSVVTNAPLTKESVHENDITKHGEGNGLSGDAAADHTSTTPLAVPTTSKRDCDYLKEIKCKSGECVPHSALCDRRLDCRDGSDERNCSCKDYLKHERLQHKVCDGILDCWDLADEIHCPWCSPEMFVCPGAKQCIPQHKVCDGHHDCPYGLDEVQCVGLIDEEEEATSMSSGQGYLQLKRNGVWGKLCVDRFPRYLSNGTWSLGEIGHAACNTLSYRKVLAIRRSKDKKHEDGSRYFEMRHEDDEKSNIALMYKETDCPRKEVLHIKCSTLECGIRPLGTSLRQRIVGGHSSAPGSWPWQVALYKEGEFQCGAALVSDRWLVTAGHCFYNTLTSHWVARMGMLRRGTEMPSPFEVVASISHAVIHPEYVDKGFANDIALLKLDKPVDFSDYIRPICLPSDGETERPRHTSFCVAVGWGKLLEVGRLFPDTLQEVPLPVLTTEECRRRTLFLPLYNITENMFCAGYERGGRDACLGDSGGPLMCQKVDGRWSLVGVTSNGDGCGRPGRPGVYTKVMRYLPWIHNTMESNPAPKPPSVCKGVRCRLGRCITQEHLCDGTKDCFDGRDEEDCPIGGG